LSAGKERSSNTAKASCWGKKNKMEGRGRRKQRNRKERRKERKKERLQWIEKENAMFILCSCS